MARLRLKSELRGYQKIPIIFQGRMIGQGQRRKNEKNDLFYDRGGK